MSKITIYDCASIDTELDLPVTGFVLLGDYVCIQIGEQQQSGSIMGTPRIVLTVKEWKSIVEHIEGVLNAVD